MNEDFGGGAKLPRRKINMPRDNEDSNLETVEFEDKQLDNNSTVPAGAEPPRPTFEPPEQPKLKPHHKFKLWYLDLSKWQQITLLIIAIILLGFTLWLAWGVTHKKSTPIKVVGHNAPPPAPTTVPSKLTGLQVDPEVNDKQVTGVMIENSLQARPQSGLDSAGIVFEALAEGGITRFLALYQDTAASYIGPVRSARPYYVQWCLGFDCAYAHVGGSPQALSDIKAWNVKDLNQFFGAAYFHRISSRSAPHNMYTSSDNLAKFEASRGYTSSKFTGFQHLGGEPKVNPDKVTVSSVNLNYPGTSYDVLYKYNSANNTYSRFEAGSPHYSQDINGKTVQIAPKVVIVMAVPLQNGALDSSNAYYSNYQTIGSGEVRIFQNGQVYSGTWRKSANESQITFTDSNGKPIQLTPGQAWVSALSSIGDAGYKVVEPPQTTTNQQPKQ